MTNHKTRLERLEESQRGHDELRMIRLADVLERPAEAAVRMGAAVVARVIELVEIAKARREAANAQPK